MHYLKNKLSLTKVFYAHETDYHQRSEPEFTR